jgi:glycosyltransferase involved in cell wall biosynthesis
VASTARPTVAFDVTPLLGARSGIGVAVAEIVAAFERLQAGPELIPYTLSVRARLHRAEVPATTRFVPVPARILLSSWTRSEHPRIDHWLKPARVVHATNYLTPPSRLPTLVSVYDCSFVRYPELCRPEVRAFDPIIRRAVARGATVHTGSSFIADEIEATYGRGLRAAGRLVVIPLGVPDLGPDAEMPPEFAAALGGAPYVLAIGTLEPRKNFPGLVTAFADVAARDPEVRLVIAGHHGPDAPAVEAAVARLPAATRDRVLLPGGVSDVARRALLGRARVLVYPSIYEGFGFPVLEAMSVGVPVVSTRAGSVPEVAGDAALLVEPTDEPALAAAIEQVLTDDAVRAELIARGRDRVHDFSWDDTARGLTATYRRLAASR